MEYFDKEISHVKQQYTNTLRKVLDDPQLVSAHTVLHLPQFRAEKVRHLSTFCKSIGNRQFVKSILSITMDAVVRMESIGRDDKKKLPVYTKDLCLLQLSFLVDNIYLPSLRQSTNLLLKHASNLYNQSANTTTTAASSSGSGSGGIGRYANNGLGGSTGVSLDILELLAVVGTFREQYSQHFVSLFQRPLLDHPNLLVICKDARKDSMQLLTRHAKETFYAWEVGLIMYLERTLSLAQSKFDFAPKLSLKDLSQNVSQWNEQLQGHLLMSGQAEGHQSSSGGDDGHTLPPTAACDAVCRAIITATQAIRAKDSDLDFLDMDNLFWRPLGQQLVATLIAHLRKLKISMSGAQQLLRDLEEYKNVRVLCL
jgi:hypothetical protein